MQTHFFRYAIAAMIALTWSGCRIGNYSQGGGPTNVFYYESAPTQTQICATATKELCASTTADQIPVEVSSVFTNPFEVYLPDPSQTAAYFVALSSSRSSPNYTGTKSGEAISFQGQASPITVFSWQDSGSTCSQLLELSMNGNSTAGAYTTNSKYPVSARMHMDIILINKFSGNCTSLFQTASNCYADIAPFRQCSGLTDADNAQRHTSVVELFGSYVSAGVLGVKDIPNVQDLHYTITYN